MKREIGEALFQIMKEDEFDLAAVTITRVETSRSLHNAHVFVSIMNHQDQRQRMMALLRKHRGEIQKRISRDIILKYTPRLSFELDTSIEKGDTVLSLLHKMERAGEIERVELEPTELKGAPGEDGNNT